MNRDGEKDSSIKPDILQTQSKEKRKKVYEEGIKNTL